MYINGNQGAMDERDRPQGLRRFCLERLLFLKRSCLVVYPEPMQRVPRDPVGRGEVYKLGWGHVKVLDEAPMYSRKVSTC